MYCQKGIFLFFVCILCSVYAFGQQIKTFQKSYGGSLNDYSLGMLPMQDKGLLIAGKTTSFGSGGTDILIVRTDSLGKAKWTKTYGGSSDEAFDQSLPMTPLDIIQVNDSDFIICTGSKSYGSGSGDIYLIKIDRYGNVKWTRTIDFSSSSDEAGASIVATPDSGFLITGQTKKSSGGGGDIFIVKTNDTGGVVWAKTYGSTGDEAAFRIIPSIDGNNYLVTGLANVQQYDFYVLKVTGSGSLLWSKVYGDTYYDVPEDIDQLPDGSIYLSGNTTNSAFGGGSSSSADNDLYILKLDSSGGLKWGKHYGGNSREVFRSLFYNNDNTIDALGGGSSYGPGNPGSVYYLKLDTSGLVLNMKTYGLSGGTQTLGFGNIFVKNEDKGFYMAGTTNGFGAGNNDFYLIKTDSTGNTNNCKVGTQTPKTKKRNPSSLAHTTSVNTISVTVKNGVTVKNVDIGNSSGKLEEAFICEPFIADFKWTNACKGQATQFYDSTYKGATTWKWNFGEALSSKNTSAVQNPLHVYNDTGTYTVKLVSSKTGAKDSITYKIRIFEVPVPVINTKDSSICLGDSIKLSTSDTAGFYWTPGNLLSDSLASEPWAYPYATTNFVLHKSNVNGCTGTDTVKITIDTSGTKCKNLVKIGGVINKYNKVESIDTCFASLTLDGSGNFKKGNKALLIQMKGAEVDTSNTSSFGEITDYKSAGKYEYIIIDSVSGNTVFSKYELLNEYDPSAAVQLVYVPVYNNVYINSNITATAWDGEKGGLVVFDAAGTVYLNDSIDVSGKGFKGGKASSSSNNNCHQSDYFYSKSSKNSAEKGESIAITDTAFSRGRGAIANGGGGGNSIYAGGGGGANIGIGGIGGLESSLCTGTKIYGGVGGYELSVDSSKNRLFFGGGGGGGEGNGFWTSTSGGNGGGIIFITAKTLSGNNQYILANGATVTDQAIRSGAGGGGGGGSVILNVETILGNIIVKIKGGNGGNAAYINECHGPGGGGGGGIVNIALDTIESSLTVDAGGGNAGFNNISGVSCGSYGADKGYTGNSTTKFILKQNYSTKQRPSGNIIKPSISVCAGDSINISAKGGVSYIWHPGKMLKDSTKQTVKAKLDNATKFTVEIYNSTGCFKTDTLTVSPAPAVSLPAVTLGCVSSVNDSTITVSWQSNFTSDSIYFKRYNIYRRKIWESLTAFYDTIGGISTNSYVDKKAYRNDTGIYVYQVRPVNICDKAGGAGIEVNSLQLVARRANAKAFALTWNKPFFTFKGTYTVEMDAGSGFRAVATTLATKYYYENCKINARFRISIKDTAKKCISYSNVTKLLKMQDAGKPNKAIILNVNVINHGRIDVSLRKNDSSDTKTYVLLRSKNGDSYTKMVTLPGASVGMSTVFFDNTVAADKDVYCYKVVSEDSCGNISDTSAESCSVNLSAKSGNLRSLLTWNKYKGYKNTDFQILQRFNLNTRKWIDIDTLAVATESYTDTINIKCRNLYFYRLATYEKGGNMQFSYSDTLDVLSYDSIAPANPEMIGVSVSGDSSIVVKWGRVKDVDVNYYKLYYSKNGSSFNLLETYHPLGPATEQFVHEHITPKTDTFCYYVEVNDSCSGLKSISKTHCAMELKGTAGNYSASLGWSAYSGFDVEKYYISVLDNIGMWKIIDSTTSTKYTHTDVSCDKYSVYRITAKEKGGNKFASFSDTVAIHPFDTIRPAQINILYASVENKNVISLAFEKAADKDVNRYDIYASTNGGSFSKIASLTKPTGNPIVYAHNSSSNNTENNIYCYRVIAVDSCKENSSLTSETHCTIKLQGTAGNNKATLKWSKYIGFGSVKAYKVQRQNGSAWITLATQTDTNFVDSLLTCNKPQTYRIIAEEDGGDKESANSNTISITPFDNVKPDAPAIQYITIKNGKPYMHWSKSASIDVRNYLVYRENESGTFVKIASVGDVDTFTDVASDASKAVFCYKIVAEDSCAKNLSLPSAPHCSALLNTSLNGCENAIYLNWTNYNGWGSIGKIEVYRTENGGSEKLLETLSSSSTSYKDTGLDFHSDYCYRIKLNEQNGNNSISWSNQSCNQTYFVDTAHIYTVSKMLTSATNGEIVVKWRSEKSKRHLAYHKLYYATSAGGSFTLLANNIPVSQDSFVHTNINTRTGEHYYYLVTIDSCGNVSDKSPTHKPVDMEVSIGQLIHNISWTKYEGFDVQSYYIQRLNGNIFKNIDTIQPTDTFNRIFPAPCNFNIFYRIGAVDKDGRIAYSDTMGRTAIDTVFANAAIIHNLTVTDGNSTKLTFRGSDSLDVYAYAIQRSEDGSWGTAGQVLFGTAGDTNNFSDNINTQKSQLCYTIITLDSCLNATMSADTFCAIQLKGQELNLANTLAWHKFKGYNVNKYSVLQYNGSSWDTLTNYTPADTSHLHIPLPCNVPVTYKIAGEENAGNRITLSDSITLVPYDTIKPLQPEIFYATVLDDKRIYAEWGKSLDDDVKKYELSIKTENTGWQIFDTLEKELNFTFDTLNTLDSAYSFGLRAIDSCAENTSMASVFHSTIQLKGEPKNLSNYLHWSAYKGFDVAKYDIYIYGNGWKWLDSTEAGILNYTHAPLACNVPQWYRIQATSIDGKYSSWSDSLQLIPFDTIIPPQPQLHFATVQPDRSIKLSWSWDTASDVKYFDIYRSTNNSSFAKIKTVIYDSSYVDDVVSPQQKGYAYYVVAIDSCNTSNRSLPSDSDTIINLHLATGACVPLIKLNWRQYSDLPQNVDAYEVYRMAGTESAYTKVAALSSTETNWVDSTVSNGITYFYKIRAVDNESGYESYSDTSGLQPFQFPVPVRAKMLYTTVQSTGKNTGSIYISWEKYLNPGDTFARGYRIYHRSGNGHFSLLYQENDLSETAYIHDSINTSDSLHEYYITVFNLCDIEGEKSEIYRPVNLEVENRNLEALVNWHPYKTGAISKYELYRSNNGGTPRLIGTFASADTSFTDLDLYCDHDYVYTIRTFLANGLESFADTVAIKAFDTIPPTNPDLYYVSVDTTHLTAGKISMMWKGNSEKNRAGYRIYRSENGGPLKLHVILKSTKTGDIFWEDVNLNTKDSFYSYAISALDSCMGNESQMSDTQRTVFLKVEAYSQYMQLNWHTYQSWKNWKFVVEKQAPNQAWRVIDTLSNSILSYVDSNVSCNILYNYRIRSIENSTNLVSLSNVAGDTAFETVLPEPPVIQHVTVKLTNQVFGEAEIMWLPSVSKDAKYYNLFRSEDGINWDTIALRYEFLSITDSFLNTVEKSYFYRLSAIDTCGNVSDVFSELHNTILLNAAAGDEKIDLDWSPYIGWPVSLYVIYRDGVAVDTVDGNTTYYADTAVICTENYQYHVVALGASPQQYTSASNTDEARPFDSRAPKQVYLKTVTVSMPNKEVTLSWDASSSYDVQQYYIYKRSGENGHITLLDSTTNLTYTETQDSITVSDCYFISAVDHCQNIGERSNRGCLMILLGNSKGKEHSLQWNGYEVWKDGVYNYKIYKKEDSGNWTEIGASAETNYVDFFINDTISTHCYQVEAMENTGTHNATSLSTTICLHQDPLVYVPNAFSPGLSEGVNDVFAPKGLNMRNFQMQIFNRWGQLIYDTKTGKGWDGTAFGRPAPEGVYLYIITVDSYTPNGTKRIKGTVTILR